MRRFCITLIFALAAMTAFSGVPNTIQVKGMGLGKTPPEMVLHDGDGWGGTIYLTLDGKEFLEGVWSGSDGDVVWLGPGGNYGIGQGGLGTYAFNRQPNGTYADTFVTHIPIATFPTPVGLMGFGPYTGAQRIVSGTGRFRHTTGVITVTGTYVWAPLAGGTQDVGHFIPEYNGFMNNVLPAK